MQSATPRLAHPVAASMVPDDVWPPCTWGRSVRQCLGTVLTEAFEPPGCCVRDLEVIEARDSERSRAASAEEDIGEGRQVSPIFGGREPVAGMVWIRVQH